MRRKMPIFYSALMLTAVNLLLRFVSTGFQVYLSGRIGATGIGLLQLVMSVGALAMTAGMAGIRTTTMYLSADAMGKKKPDQLKWILSGCIAYSILCSSAISISLYLFAPQIATNWIGDPDCVSAIRLYSAFIPVYCLCGLMTGYFTAANKISTLAAVEVAEQFFCIGITILLLQTGGLKNAQTACSSVIAGSGISVCLTLCILVCLRFREPPVPGIRIPVRKKLLQTAVPLALADDLKVGINTVENLMVPKRLALYGGTTEPLAAFGTVCGMVFPVLMFPASILFGLAELLIPELARCTAAGSQQRIRYLVKRSLKVAMLYGCILGGLEFLLAEVLCIRLYDNSEAGQYLRLYALLIPMLYCDALTDAMTKGLGQQKACVRYNIITASMDVVFLFILLPQYGMIGYFISFFITHLLNFILSFRRLLKITKLRFRFRTPLLCASSTIIAINLSGFTASNYMRSITFLLIMGALLSIFGIITREDAHWITGLVKKK